MAHDILTDTYQRIRGRLAAMASAMLGNTADVDDTLQESFCRLWRRRGDIRDNASAEGMLMTTVRNTGIDMLRRRTPSEPADSDERLMAIEDNTDTDACDGLLAEITALIDEQLTERQRLILYQRDRYEWSYGEIAAYHGITEANVRMTVSRARRTIREIYLNRHRSLHHES